MTVVVPNALALTTIVDGSSIVASDHRNNYAATQVGVNGLIAMFAVAASKGDLIVSAGGGSFDRLGVGSNGQVVGADSTQPLGVKWVTGPGTELDYVAQPAPATINTTTEGTAVTVITGTSRAYDGTKNNISFFVPQLDTGGTTVTFVFLRGATVLGQAKVSHPGGESEPVSVVLQDTPAASTFSYVVKAFVASGAVSLFTSSGGPGALLPTFLRVTKA